MHNCSWESERHGETKDSTNGSNLMMSALMVYPNPAKDEVTLSYDYGSFGNSGRSMIVYNQMGEKMNIFEPQSTHGSYSIDVSNWAPGVYFVLMAGDGNTLQTQKLIVGH